VIDNRNSLTRYGDFARIIKSKKAVLQWFARTVLDNQKHLVRKVHLDGGCSKFAKHLAKT